MKCISFAGEKEVGYRSLISLQNSFDKILISKESDENVLSLKREQDEIVSDFRTSEAKYVFLAGYPKFITEEELKQKIYINIHGALLPKFRGMHSFFWSVMNGEEYLGLTVHLVDKFMDSGDIIHQFKVKYEGQKMYQVFDDLYRKVENELGFIVLAYINQEIIAQPQDKKEASWGCKRNLMDCLIDFHWENEIIRRFFLALTEPYPLPRICVRKIVYEVVNAKIIDKKYFVDIGRCLNVDNEGVWIKTKEGFLIVDKLRDIKTLEYCDPRDIIPIGYRF